MANKTFKPEALRYDDRGLIPAVVQDASTGQVLMLAYMNEASVKKTLETGYTWFYSRSRQALWQKGESSGHVQKVTDIATDCDQDAIVVQVIQTGVACHTGQPTCFHHGIQGLLESGKAGTALAKKVAHDMPWNTLLDDLYTLIVARKKDPVEGSYTSYLFAEGIDKILKKVGEESTEVIIAAKGKHKAGVVEETADLLYHLLVMLAEMNVSPDLVLEELAKRRGGGGGEDVPPGK